MMAALQANNWPFVINMGNSIIGVSVLAMPFCFKQCGVLLGMLLMAGSSWLTYMSCSLLVKAAHTSRKRSYEYLAFYSFGSAGKLAVEISIIGLLLGTCIAFYVIIGDLGPVIISKITGFENTSQLRTTLMISLGLFIALPLGLLRSLQSLSNISAISFAFYFVFVSEVCMAALPNLWSGVWVSKVVYWNPEGVFKCLPIFSLAFSCQTQLFLMYDALPEPSLKRMATITKSAIGLCSAIYLAVGYFGYVAFCDEDISGDVLMNFRPTLFSESVKFGFVLAVTLSFPLVIFPCRAAIHTLLAARLQEDEEAGHDHPGGPTIIPELRFKVITICIVIGTLIVGIYVPNVEFVLALTGATMGSMISYIFPAVMFINVMSMAQNNKSLAQFVLFLGVTILLASTYVTLNVSPASPAQSVVKIAPAIEKPDLVVPALPDPAKPIVPLAVDEILLKNDIKKIEDINVKDKTVKKDESVEAKRQEPPNPHPPQDGDAPHNTVKPSPKSDDKEKTGHEQQVKKPDEKKDEVVDAKIKADGAEQKIKVQDVLDDKAKLKEDKEAGLKKEDVEKKIKVEDVLKKDEAKKALSKDSNAEAKKILQELKIQQQEQKELIKEQRKIIKDLQKHQKEHDDKDKAMKLADQQKDVKPAAQVNVDSVPQQNVGQQVLQQNIPQQNIPQQNILQQNVPQQNVPQQNVPQQNVPQQNVPQQNVPQINVPQQNVPQQNVPQQNVPQQNVPQENVPKQNVPQQNVLQQNVPQENVMQQNVPQQNAPQLNVQGNVMQQNVPQQNVIQQNVPLQNVAQQNVPQQDVLQQNVPQQNAIQQNVPQQNVVQQNLLQQNVPLQNVPQQDVLQQNVPQQDVLQQNLPQQNVPQENAMQQNVPQQNVPQQNVAQQNVPQQNIPLQNDPLQNVPQQNVPLQNVPQQNPVPQQNVPHQNVPVQNIQQHEQVAKENVVQQNNVQEVPQQNVPVAQQQAQIPEQNVPQNGPQQVGRLPQQNIAQQNIPPQQILQKDVPVENIPQQNIIVGKQVDLKDHAPAEKMAQELLKEIHHRL